MKSIFRVKDSNVRTILRFTDDIIVVILDCSIPSGVNILIIEWTDIQFEKKYYVLHSNTKNNKSLLIVDES